MPNEIFYRPAQAGDTVVDIDNAPTISTVIADSANLDAFSRLRVSNPTNLFDAKTIRGTKEALFWVESLTAGGTSTHMPDRSSTFLTVTNAGDAVIRQSRSRFPYQPGKSHLVFVTWQPPTAAEANARCRVGLFDDENGIFLQLVGDTLTWVVRSSVGGAPDDANAASAATWNLDGLGLSGNTLNPSGRTLDTTKNLLMVVDFQWLALGRVRVGFDLGGSVVYVHEFNHSNITTAAYMANPNLVIRYEITATGEPAGPTTLEAICASVSSEGGHDPIGLPTYIDNNIVPVVVTRTYEELIAFRVKSSSVTRAVGFVVHVNIVATTNANVAWKLLLNPTGQGVGTWVSAGENSSVEFNVSRGTGWTLNRVTPHEDHIAGGGYFTSSTDTTASPVTISLRAGATVAGVADVWAIVACNATANVNESLFCGLTIQELF